MCDDISVLRITIFFTAFGELKKYFPNKRYNFTLPRGATLRDFYNALGEGIGHMMPASLWLKEENKFSSSIIVTIEGKVISDLSYSLDDGQTIRAYRIVIGG